MQHRRQFMKGAAALTAGCLGLNHFANPLFAAPSSSPFAEDLLNIRPLEGYSPNMGVLVAMLNYNRSTIIRSIKNLKVEELDFLIDPKANTIGALVLHLGAVDKFYQINSFEGRQQFNDAEKKEWDAAMRLGDKGRAEIKGHDAQWYIDKITAVRQKTLNELKKRDDQWLFAVDPLWSNAKDGKINTYWKWFHVCEHESNHRGQITWLKGRLPGAKGGGD